MVKITKKIILISYIFTLLFLAVGSVHAVPIDDYTVLAPLPGTTNGDCTGGTTPIVGPTADMASGGCKTNLPKYLSGLFNLFIGISAVMAFVMLTYAGFQYMITDNIGTKSSAKNTMENAILGLVMVIGAYAILYTINPQILDFKLTTPGLPQFNKQIISLPTLGGELSAATGKTLPGYTLNAEQVAQNTSSKNDLSKYNVSVNNGPCVNGEVSGCTNLVGMPTVSYQGVKDLAKDCGCNVMITGGTEGGHASHGPNLSTLDLRNDTGINTYITNKDNWVAQPSTQFGYPAYTVRISDTVNATFVKESDHWHVMFGK